MWGERNTTSVLSSSYNGAMKAVKQKQEERCARQRR